MRFLAGFLLGAFVTAAMPFLLLATGSFDAAATAGPTALEQSFAPWALERSLARRAPVAKNPHPESPELLAKGLLHFRESCVVCHGAPGVDSGEAARGLSPTAPSLDAPAVQRRTDGQLFWLTKNGVRMTGMPAWGPTHSDEEIWQLVAFVRHLPLLTEDERSQLKIAPPR